jgi:hypothetical protein
MEIRETSWETYVVLTSTNIGIRRVRTLDCEPVPSPDELPPDAKESRNDDPLGGSSLHNVPHDSSGALLPLKECAPTTAARESTS